MTLMFPDVSSYQAGLRIQPGTVAVVAKATQGTTYSDPDFHDFMNQAAAVGAIGAGYHFLEQGNGFAQADYCHQFAGEVPIMVDCEPGAGSKPTMSDVLDFIERYHGLGGRVWGVYYPHWYWQETGGDLRPLRDIGGACLISSSYSGYTDSPTGAGWQPYGGLTPAIWQYTNNQPCGGKSVDFNAFRGTLDDLHNLIMGDDMTPHDVWAFRGNNGDGAGPDAPDVHQSLLTTRDNTNAMRGELDQVKTEVTDLAAVVGRIAAHLGA
jgi:lysozyme